ncbi:MAG TPA: hypothetical protein VMX17_11290 [Candidatus Glassbacteria bacterium]|nr:hypothetical protein [Candidatus Glassbacteria bacterium]
MAMKNFRLAEGYPIRNGELSTYKNNIYSWGLPKFNELIGYEFLLLRTPSSKGFMISGSVFEGEYLEVII